MPGRLDVGTGEGRRGVYLLTHPRSASNMFQTMMSKQPGFQNSGYKLFDASFAWLTQLQRGRLSDWPEGDREALYNAFRAGFESLQDELDDAEKNGKQVFLKEHALFLSGPDKHFAQVHNDNQHPTLTLHPRDAPSPTTLHTNPTSLPDTLLLSMRPIFQIRHPILMFPSMVRAEQKAMGSVRPRDPILSTTLTLSHSRALYDWYLAQDTTFAPQVVDADDIIHDRAAVRHVCLQTGLDPDAVMYEWETREEKDPRKAAFLSTIYASKGIIPGLAAKGLDFETERAKWREEFGVEDGEDLARFVQEAMADYEYLLSRRTYL